MAGDWIKMRSNLVEDPAVISIAAQLGLDEFSVVGRLHFLWAWFDEQSRDGHAHGVTKAWVDRKVQRDGFADAMETERWLAVTETGIYVPNFDRHNGETAKVRALGTKRKQNQRARDADDTDSSRDSSRSERDKNETREEKRREDKYPPTPLDEIVELYHQKLPKLPQVKLKTEKRTKACRDFWRWIFDTPKSDGQARAATPDQALTWISGYFEKAASNDFLMGNRSGQGHESWKADFDFLLTERGRKHVIERTEAA